MTRSATQSKCCSPPSREAQDNDLAAMNRISISVGRPHEVIYQDRRGREKISTARILSTRSRDERCCVLDIDGNEQSDLNSDGCVHTAAYAYTRQNAEITPPLGQSFVASVYCLQKFARFQPQYLWRLRFARRGHKIPMNQRLTLRPIHP